MIKFLRLFYPFLMVFALSGAAFCQLYSYKTPSGRLMITDHPIHKPGYKLIASKRPKNELRLRTRRFRTSGKYQLTPDQLDTLVNPIAKSMGIDPQLVKAVIEVESSRNYRIVSKKGARGLMQLIPATAMRFGVQNSFDPRENIKGGVRYLKFLLGYFEGHVDHVLAAYNAGEYAVDKYGGIPPFKETRNYIRKIRKYYSPRKHPYDPGVSYRSKLIKNSKKPSVRPITKLAKAG